MSISISIAACTLSVCEELNPNTFGTISFRSVPGMIDPSGYRCAAINEDLKHATVEESMDAQGFFCFCF